MSSGETIVAVCMYPSYKNHVSTALIYKSWRRGRCKHYGYTDGNVPQPSELSSSTVVDAPNVSDSDDEVSDHGDTDSVVVHVECARLNVRKKAKRSHPTIVANSMTFVSVVVISYYTVI